MSVKKLLLLLSFIFLASPIISLDAQQADSTVETIDLPNNQIELPATTSAPRERRYLVEVIIFNNLGPISADGEIWEQTLLPVKLVPEITSSGPGIQENDLSISTEETVRFTDLKALMPHLYKLYSSPHYEVLTYVAWTQPLFRKRESLEVDLVRPVQSDSLKEIKPPPSVQGSLQLFENRLLFVDLDIENHFNDPIKSLTPVIEQNGRQPGTYRLQEKRRVKLNEIHYFDHPYFGALVRVSRWEPDQAG